MKKLLPYIFTLIFLSIINMQAGSVHDITLKDIDGNDTSLANYEGKVVLIVNVASECGHTPQYKGLEALYQKYQDNGLVVLGVPCNQFGGQEPGSNEDIKEFCSTTFQVTFPLSTKIEVNGENRHPLYVKLAGESSPFSGNIGWNFTKFLIGKDGTIINRFESGIQPESDEVVSAIESALES